MAIRDIVQAAAGVGGGSEYVEDVFSTYLFTGNGSTQTITNGIDLAGEGGLVWLKNRDSTSSHRLVDTVRGALSTLFSESTSAALSRTSPNDDVDSFTSTGFVAGNYCIAADYVSWSWRKAPKFFDVVTWTGNGSTQNISHSLDSQPGCVMIKKTSGAGDWMIWHRGLSAGHYIRFTTSAQNNSFNDAYFGNSTTYVDPTSTQFTVGYGDLVNSNGATFVAYVFAHDAGGFGDDGEQDVISCGSFTTDGSGNAIVNLGYEPQWVLVKPASTAGQWRLFDTMRGFSHLSAAMLLPNLANAEGVNTTAERYFPTATGFNLTPYDAGGVTSIYMAIRRPMKTPKAGTEVFMPFAASDSTRQTTGFPTDMFLDARRSGNSLNTLVGTRLVGPTVHLITSSSGAETTGAGSIGDAYQYNDSFKPGIGFDWWCAFKRAPSVFDVVCYTGTGGVRTVAHNLGVVPELLITKHRSSSSTGDWYSSYGNFTNWLQLNTTSSAQPENGIFGSTMPTSSVFSVGYNGANESSATFVAYLFASLPGVSKVSSYSGTGNSVNVDCGFSGGARFILIKRTDSTGDWYLWDSARGIVAGNDPYLLLNTTAAQVTNTDYIDPLASGFTVTSSAPAALNASGGSYIFLAIA